MTAFNAKGSGSGVHDQATRYLYGSAVNTSWQTGAIYPDSTDVLSQDPTTKVWTITTDNGDHVATSYDRLGRKTGTTDQRGVVHEYAFDSAGRPSADTVTSLGSTGLVDGSVRRIGSTYDDLGRVQTVTSYSDTSGAAALNQVKYEYNGRGRVSKEYQEHDGVVDTGSLSVQYTYADGASDGVAKYARLSNVVYPNGRNLHYGYGTAGAIDDIMSRLATIGDGTNTQASYKYLGAGRIVAEDYAESQVKLDYTTNNLAPLDRFGRVTDQVWTDYGTTPETFDEYTYSYNRAGNRTSRTNALRTALSETYQYNGVDALVSSVRNDSFDQSWTLDGLGNWSGFNDDGSSQARTANAANEIGSITGGWATPAYDPAGNMTVIPAPLAGDADHALSAKYDAWNHLVETSDGGVLVAKFVYDGAGRRIESLTNYVGGVPQQSTHYYLSGQNQVLETREGSPASSPESLSPKYQNVWSPRYIDALILRDSYSGGVLQPASRLYYLSDANYNVTAIVGKVNNTWQAVERYAYTAYGKAAIYTPDWSSTGSSSLYNNTTLYTGRELDASTSLYYYRARYYSADLGTFAGRDPIGYRGGINLYEYVTDSPLTRTDPTGMIDLFGPINPLPPISKPEPPIPFERKRPPYTIPCKFYDANGHCQLTVAMFCRKMPDEKEFLGTQIFSHCYLAIRIANTNNYIDTLSGQQTGLDPNMLVRTDDKDMQFDYGHLLNGTGGNRIRQFSTQGNACEFWKCAQDAANAFSNTTRYNQYLNNSNTLLTHVIKKCGGRANFPWTAFGSDDIGYGWL